MTHEPNNTYIALPDGEEAIATIREQFQLDLDAERENRREMEDDLRFSANDQWTDEAKKSRKGLPCLTINMTGQYVRQVTGDIRLIAFGNNYCSNRCAQRMHRRRKAGLQSQRFRRLSA